MPAYYSSTAYQFISTSQSEVVGQLSVSTIRKFKGDHTKQLPSWERQVDLLQNILRDVINRFPDAGKWGVLFEYPLLRLGGRPDVVILAGASVVVIEFKVGAKEHSSSDIQQVETYALDLRDFHEASHRLTILPVLCATEARGREYSLPHSKGVGPTCCCNAVTLGKLLEEIASQENGQQIDVHNWNSAPYRPVPSIIEAAELLFAGHEVREIDHASSAPDNLGATTDRLIEIVSSAQQRNEHIVVFVTGIPGSGKTLVGLNAIHDPRFRQQGRKAGAFLSSNRPLVRVLRDALARDDMARTKRKKHVVQREIRSQIQELMNYLEEYLDSHPNEAPSDHVVVFDEAQRAWDADYGQRRFKRHKSEPALFLEIMGRHADWGVIIALVGGGQEINDGEKGLSGWGSAIVEYNREVGNRHWRVVAPPDMMEGGHATAWQRLFPHSEPHGLVERDERLHLAVSARSYRCLETTKWVNNILDGRVDNARKIAKATDDFPIFLTRSLGTARSWLLSNARGNRRCGLVATTGARRLRAEGLGVSIQVRELDEVANWYLLPRGDIRSSSALEVTVNEYTCQGLELDYAGVCWGGDLIWCSKEKRWVHRKLSGPKWQLIKDSNWQCWILNKYRVLLTRSRLGTIIWVPRGNEEDATRSPERLDAVANYLKRAGARMLD